MSVSNLLLLAMVVMAPLPSDAWSSVVVGTGNRRRTLKGASLFSSLPPPSFASSTTSSSRFIPGLGISTSTTTTATTLQAAAGGGEDGGKKKKKAKTAAKKKKAAKKKAAKAKKKKAAKKKQKKAAATTASAEAAAPEAVAAVEALEAEVLAAPPKADVPAAAVTALKAESESTTDITTKTPATAEKTEEKLKDDYTPDIDPEILEKIATGGRPGAIIETEEQLEIKEQIIRDYAQRDPKTLPDWYFEYGEPEDEEDAEWDIDDPDAIDSGSLGKWDIFDLKARFEYDFDPEAGDPDPNVVEMTKPDYVYVKSPPVDEEGIELFYDPLFGSSNPIDERTVVTVTDSYMVNEKTKNETMLTPEFEKGDLEIEYNEDVAKFRKSLGIIQTYTDEFLPDHIEMPHEVAKWHGYPEMINYPKKGYNNNRFTDPKDKTDFDSMTPYEARVRAVELARAKNAEWLPPEKSYNYHKEQRAIYDEPRYQTLIGTLRKDEETESKYPVLVEKIQPALDILGNIVTLLSIERECGEDYNDQDFADMNRDNDNKNEIVLGGQEEEEEEFSLNTNHNYKNGFTVFRFHFHGFMKHKYGMSCWTETLIRDCGVPVTGVVFETGFRKRDYIHDGGDCWYGPAFDPPNELMRPPPEEAMKP